MWKKIIALLLLFAITIPGYRSHIFSLDFVDEEDNIVIGSYLEKGKKLYRDVYSQHQPAQFVIANVLQTVTTPDNILMTVKRHREFMILWSLFWITLLTFRFGFPLYFTSLIFELTKMILLGNMFLAETFVVYPLLYLLSAIFHKSKSMKPLEEFFVLSLIWFLALSLTPLWPLLFVVTVYLFTVTKSKLHFLFLFLAPGALSFLLLYPKVDFLDYYHDAFWINTNFYIPLTTGIGTVSALLHSFFFPFFTVFAKGESLLLPLLKLLSFVYLYNLFVLFHKKEYMKAFMLHLILFLSNLRYIDPTNTLYGAFHMLPWYGTLLFSSIAFLSIPKFPRTIVLILALIFSCLIAKQVLWDKRDLNTDYYVHYSPSEDLSQAIKIISKYSPRSLWVEPVNYWLHYQNNSTLYTTMIFYYSWMDKVPPFTKEVSNAISQNLPDIIYLHDQNLALQDQLDKYTPILRDNKATMLFIRSDLVSTLTPTQLEELSFYRFTF